MGVSTPRGPTAEQRLAAAVGEGQVLDGGEAPCQGSAQVTRVAQRPHSQAVQVDRLHQVGQERPLESDDAPPVDTKNVLQLYPTYLFFQIHIHCDL